MRALGLPAHVLVGKLKKDISFALRRVIAQVSSASTLPTARSRMSST
jgi:hypothetical protein